jgi:predicted nucleotidyltransferase
MKKFLSKNQLLLLRLFYTNPARAYYVQEIGRALGKKPGVFQRTLNRLAEEGILESEYRANARFFRANTDYALYEEFRKIVSKTIGAEASLKELVEGIRGIDLALIYGSFAKSTERKDSDIDVLVVAGKSAEDRLLSGISDLEKKIQREINYKLYSPEEFRAKRKRRDPFLAEILSDSYILLKGNPDAV